MPPGGEETQTDTTTTTNGASTTQQTGTSPANGGQQTGDAKLTQAEVDFQIKERLQRDREARDKELLTSLGVNSRDELKKLLDEKRQRDESELSESQKKDKALETAKADREKLEAELKQEREARRQEKVDVALRAAAKGAVDADDVVTYIRDKLADDLAKLVKEDGSMEEKPLTELIAKVRKAKPHFFGAGTPGSPSNADGRAPTQDEIKKRLGDAPLSRL